MDRFKFRVWKQDSWGYNLKNEFVKQKPHYEYFELNNNILFHRSDITEQCTGLKDKNGKLIYEGDILESNNTILEVFWWSELGSFAFKKEKSVFTMSQQSIALCGFEIIGNVHENPKLLENK